MGHFPGDLITEILICLPVKSVLRFRCVSKSLCTIIDSPNFANYYLRRSSENINRRKVILQHTSLKNEPRRFHIIDMNDGEEQEILLEKPSLDIWKNIYGNCNGLLLIYGSCCKIALWNPSTRKYMNLPDCPSETVRNYRIFGLGLGYDNSINDYKVVLMLSTLIQTQVWIYRMRLKMWTRIKDCPNCVGLYSGFGYFADGSLHWLGSGDRDILAFDVKKEMFSLLPQPFYPTKPILTDLHVLEWCLCFSFSFGRHSDLYIRKKDEFNQFTWERLCYVKEPIYPSPHYPGRVKVLGYSKSTNKIILSYGINKLVSYNIEEKSFGNIKMDNPNLWLSFCFPVFCIESLVWV